MSDEETHFALRLNGIVLEISGDRAFVDKMYRLVMSDLEQARERARQPQTAHAVSSRAALIQERPQTPLHDPVVWIHRCTELVHKIYMGSASELRLSPVFRVLDPSKMGVLYVSDGLFKKFLPQFERGQTLWAELTPAGREQIREAGRARRGDS